MNVYEKTCCGYMITYSVFINYVTMFYINNKILINL